MPAKRRIPATAAEASAAPKMRQSKLAKEHNITGAEESEIKEAWSMFSKPMQGEKEGIIEIGDVRRAMIALGITPTPAELKEFNSILDPEDEGFAIYPSFVAICALKMHSRSRTSEAHNEEVEEAFNMFARLGKGDRNGEERITMRTLQKIAKALNEDVEDGLLKDMILEANGGKGVDMGVDKDDFEGVMRRAGVWR